jgi:hypothetical protein
MIDMAKEVANEPSMGLYFMQEHMDKVVLEVFVLKI